MKENRKISSITKLITDCNLNESYHLYNYKRNKVDVQRCKAKENILINGYVSANGSIRLGTQLESIY